MEMKPKVNETAVDDEMIDERERKKKTAPFGVIILILIPPVILVVLFVRILGWDMTVKKDLSVEIKEKITDSYNLSCESDFEIESLSLMHHAVKLHFFVLELKVDDFEKFCVENQQLCQNSYKFFTERRHIFLYTSNFAPLPDPNDEQNRYTVYYTDDTVYISIYTGEAREIGNDVEEYFFDIL